MTEVVEELFGGVEREAIHGAGNVDDEEIVAGWNVLRSDAGGRLKGELQEVLVASFVKKKAGGDGLVSEAIIDEDVAVVAGVVAGALPRKGGAFLGGKVDVNGVAGGLDGLKGRPASRFRSRLKDGAEG